MITIFTKQHYESSTDEVIEWLKYYEADFIKINGSDFYKNFILHCYLGIKRLFFSLGEQYW